MNIHLYQAALAACLFLSACQGAKTTHKDLAVIPLGQAFETPTKLKASDCFKQIRYIPLETNDSCLIGKSPSIKILHDKLLVTTGQDQCFLFDKATGRFLTSVGHVGNDPEGYSDSKDCWLNHPLNQIYFAGWNDKQKIYDANGTYVGELSNPIKNTTFPANTVINYLDERTMVAHTTAGGGKPDRVTVFRDSTIINEFMPSGQDTSVIGLDPENIESLSVISNHGLGSKMLLFTYKDSKAGAYLMGDYFFWHQGKDLFFKEQFNDTIYQVTADALLPVRRFDFGKYRWESADRFDPEKDHAIYPTEIMEGNDMYIIRFATDIHTERMVYNAICSKKTGIAKVSDYRSAIDDDLNGFLPLQPESVSPDGQFAQIITADQIITWFEENADKTDIPTDIAALKQVREEDNPVVVIME